MRLHNGNISVFSAGPGSGSTFTVDIATVAHGHGNGSLVASRGGYDAIGTPSLHSPLDERSSAQVAPQATSISRHSTHRNRSDFRISIATPRVSSFEPLTVLVVDDSALNRKMLCRSLRDRFIIVGDVECGEAAVDFVANQMASEEKLVEVIIMDYRMPGMDGPTAAKAIRGMGYNRVIVGLTGNVLEEDMSYFVECGADAVMMKPVDPEALAQRIIGED